MSKIELLAKIELLNKYEAMMEEMKAEADRVRDSIKAEMMEREVEELIAGQYIIRWTSVLSNRFDSTAFKRVCPEIYKQRVFTVPLVIWQYIENYCLRNQIRSHERIFPITERAVQKQLQIVCDYLGFEGISTHSFRKWYATEIYKASGYDITLVQRLLQHSSATTTQRYIGMEPQRIEEAIQNHAQLL